MQYRPASRAFPDFPNDPAIQPEEAKELKREYLDSVQLKLPTMVETTNHRNGFNVFQLQIGKTDIVIKSESLNFDHMVADFYEDQVNFASVFSASPEEAFRKEPVLAQSYRNHFLKEMKSVATIDLSRGKFELGELPCNDQRMNYVLEHYWLSVGDAIENSKQPQNRYRDRSIKYLTSNFAILTGVKNEMTKKWLKENSLHSIWQHRLNKGSYAKFRMESGRTLIEKKKKKRRLSDSYLVEMEKRQKRNKPNTL